MARIGQSFGRNVAGIGGNVSLGLLLGMLPVFGKFLGVPLEVRHVTLSTGSLAFAGSALGAEATVQTHYLLAAAGIVLIGALNFGVSFALALAVALRASARWQRGTRSFTADLMAGLAKRIRRNPLEFLFPPRATPEATPTDH